MYEDNWNGDNEVTEEKIIVFQLSFICTLRIYACHVRFEMGRLPNF